MGLTFCIFDTPWCLFTFKNGWWINSNVRPLFILFPNSVRLIWFTDNVSFMKIRIHWTLYTLVFLHNVQLLVGIQLWNLEFCQFLSKCFWKHSSWITLYFKCYSSFKLFVHMVLSSTWNGGTLSGDEIPQKWCHTLF